MPTVERFLQPLRREIAMSLDETQVLRRDDEIRNIANPAKRTAAWLVHQTIGIAPYVVDELHHVPYAARNMDAIGFGYHSTAIRVEDSVYKLLRRTAQIPPENLPRYKAELEAKQRQICEAVGPYAVDQVFAITANPFKRGGRIIAAHQPYVDLLRPVDVLRDDPDTYSNGQRQQVADILGRSLSLYDTTGVMVDLSGYPNLGFTSANELQLVDTLPNESAMLDKDALAQSWEAVLPGWSASDVALLVSPSNV